MKTKISIFLLLLLESLILCNPAFGQYQIIDLGNLPSYTESRALSINNYGQIVGYSGEGAIFRATLFDLSGVNDNINLGGFEIYESYGGSHALCTNNQGQIVGCATYDGFENPHAALFDPTGMAANIDLAPDIFMSVATSINDSGQIVGYCSDAFGSTTQATLFDPTGLGNNTNISPSQDSCMARSINNQGNVVGWWSSADFDRHAILFDITGGDNYIDLGVLSDGERSEAYSINNNDQIVGSSGGHAVLFDITGLGNNIDLSTPGAYGDSEALCINNNGQIVGYEETMQGRHAFLFDSSGIGNNIDLNTLLSQGSGWEMECAYSINDNGWIVGYGRNPENEIHAFLLQPIPEPCMLSLLAFGAFFLKKKRS